MVLFLNYTCFSQSQTSYYTDWVKNYLSINNGQFTPNDIAIDNNSNVYITGLFTNTIDFDPGTAVTNGQAISSGFAIGTNQFIVKYDVQGNYLWHKIIGLNGFVSGNTKIKIKDSFLYISGSISGQGDMDPGPSTVLKGSSGSTVTVSHVVKLDLDGNYNNSFVVGNTGAISGSNTIIRDFDVDNNNLIITGDFNLIADFNPSVTVNNLTTAGISVYNPFVAKYDLSLNYVWAKKWIDNNYISKATCVEICQNGDLIIGGAYRGTADFDPGISTNMSTATSNVSLTYLSNGYLLKLSSTGNYITHKVFNGLTNNDNSYVIDVELDLLDNLYLSVSAQSSIDFDLASGVSYLSSCFVKYNSSFVKQWHSDMPNSSNSLKICGNDIYSSGQDVNYKSVISKVNLLSGSKVEYSFGSNSTWSISSITNNVDYLFSIGQNGANTVDNFITGTLNHYVNSNNGYFHKIKMCSATYYVTKDSICVNDSVFWQGQWYSNPNTYYHVFQNQNGCDSIHQLSLDNYTPPQFNTPVVISSSSVFVGYDVSLSAPFFQNMTYSWTGPNGFVSNEQKPTIYNVNTASTGNYILTLIDNQTGCSYIDSSLFIVALEVIYNLPITLTSFTAECFERKVNLNWATESENNVSHFVLERSINGMDWEKCDSVLAVGNSHTHNLYTSIVPVVENLIYFKLKELDTDGHTRSYGPISVVCDNIEQDLFYLLNNPSTSNISLYLLNPSELNYSITIKSMLGNTIIKENNNNNGLFVYPFIQPGIYFVEASNSSNRTIKKVIVN